MVGLRDLAVGAFIAAVLTLAILVGCQHGGTGASSEGGCTNGCAETVYGCGSYTICSTFGCNSNFCCYGGAASCSLCDCPNGY